MKFRYLFCMPIVEPFSPGHAVELTLPGSFEVGDPLVVLPLEQLVVELGALLLTEVPDPCRTRFDVAGREPLGGAVAVRTLWAGAGLDENTPAAGSRTGSVTLEINVQDNLGYALE